VIGGKTTDLIGVQTLGGENAASTAAQGVSILTTEISAAILTAKDSTQETPQRSESISNLLDDASPSQIKDAKTKVNEKKGARRQKKNPSETGEQEIRSEI
jgi:hypothetical protein